MRADDDHAANSPTLPHADEPQRLPVTTLTTPGRRSAPPTPPPSSGAAPTGSDASVVAGHSAQAVDSSSDMECMGVTAQAAVPPTSLPITPQTAESTTLHPTIPKV